MSSFSGSTIISVVLPLSELAATYRVGTHPPLWVPILTLINHIAGHAEADAVSIRRR